MSFYTPNILFWKFNRIVFIKHYEDTSQIIPIFCIGLSLTCLIILF